MFGKKIDRWLSEGIIKMMRKKANLERKEMRVEGHRIVYLENERKDKKTLIINDPDPRVRGMKLI